MSKTNKDNKHNPLKKVRFNWSRNPVEDVHSTKKGDKGYKRTNVNQQFKRFGADALDEIYEEID